MMNKAGLVPARVELSESSVKDRKQTLIQQIINSNCLECYEGEELGIVCKKKTCVEIEGQEHPRRGRKVSTSVWEEGQKSVLRRGVCEGFAVEFGSQKQR